MSEEVSNILQCSVVMEKEESGKNEDDDDKKEDNIQIVINNSTNHYNNIQNSLLLDNEIQSLIEQSLYIKQDDKCIYVQLFNYGTFNTPITLLLSHRQSISTELRELLWGSNLSAINVSQFPSENILNEKYLKEIYKQCIKTSLKTYGRTPLYHNQFIGILGAFYTKISRSNNTSNNQYFNGYKYSRLRKYWMRSNNHIKCYNDFSLLVVYNGKIQDYAIHRQVSNIEQLVEKYDIKIICVDAFDNESLYTVVTHPCGIFHGINNVTLHYIPIRKSNRTIFQGLFQFCPDNNTYSSFYQALQYLIKLIDENFTKPKPNIKKNNNRELLDYHNSFYNNRKRAAAIDLIDVNNEVSDKYVKNQRKIKYK